MNGVDEVAVKLVKADKPTQKEMSLFHKEVNPVENLHSKSWLFARKHILYATTGDAADGNWGIQMCQWQDFSVQNLVLFTLPFTAWPRSAISAVAGPQQSLSMILQFCYLRCRLRVSHCRWGFCGNCTTKTLCNSTGPIWRSAACSSWQSWWKVETCTLPCDTTLKQWDGIAWGRKWLMTPLWASITFTRGTSFKWRLPALNGHCYIYYSSASQVDASGHTDASKNCGILWPCWGWRYARVSLCDWFRLCGSEIGLWGQEDSTDKSTGYFLQKPTRECNKISKLEGNYVHSAPLWSAPLLCRKPPMMHRDLKSPNVLLSEEGVAKIADVGMVRAQVKDLVTAQPVMTPLWAAPEVSVPGLTITHLPQQSVPLNMQWLPTCTKFSLCIILLESPYACDMVMPCKVAPWLERYLLSKFKYSRTIQKRQFWSKNYLLGIFQQRLTEKPYAQVIRHERASVKADMWWVFAISCQSNLKSFFTWFRDCWPLQPLESDRNTSWYVSSSLHAM